MKRQLPPEVDQVKNWCLANKKFEEARFIIAIKDIMESGKQISGQDAQTLTSILRAYILNKDLEQKIKDRMSWWKR